MSESAIELSANSGGPPKRKRGRPPGVKMRIAADKLRHHHFSFIRTLIEIPDQGLKKPWERYLAFEGGTEDERHYAAKLRELIRVIRFAASQRGLDPLAEVALAGVTLLAAPPALPSSATTTDVAQAAIPSMDEWVAERCEQLGVDYYDYRESEWLEMYQDEFGLDQPLSPMPATIVPEASSTDDAELPDLRERLEALNSLSSALARPPALTDTLPTWLSEDLARRLAGAEVDGKRIPILTIDNLISFVNLYHYRWWVHVPRLGRERGDRLTAWLTSLASDLGRPLKEIASKPLHELRLQKARAVQGPRRYGMVPLDQLAVPPELNGSKGIFRNGEISVWDVDTDVDAIFSWMRRHAKSPRTSDSYGPIVERFYLWSVLVKRKAMSSLSEGDMMDYLDFISRPPVDWIQERQVVRGSNEWRPFKGPLGAASRKRNFIVISTMLTKMLEAGYLRANAALGALESIKVPGASINIDRSFTEGQWAFVMRCWSESYVEVGPAFSPDETQPFCPDDEHCDKSFLRAAALRRLRLLLELGATTGLRLSEFATTRRSSLKLEVVDGDEVWLIHVLGKGNKPREVVLFEDVLMMLEQHHRDMDVANTSFDKTNKRELRKLYAEDAKTSEQVPAGDGRASPLPPPNDDEELERVPDWANRPLVGALRRTPRRWKLNAEGVKELDKTAPGNADPYGAIDPSALYQSLKRFFAVCSRKAAVAGMGDENVKSLVAASTHWMRHFFANTAIADGVEPAALMDAMGHASLNTTSIYLRTERKRLVGQLSKLRRRG